MENKLIAKEGYIEPTLTNKTKSSRYVPLLCVAPGGTNTLMCSATNVYMHT